MTIKLELEVSDEQAAAFCAQRGEWKATVPNPEKPSEQIDNPQTMAEYVYLCVFNYFHGEAAAGAKKSVEVARLAEDETIKETMRPSKGKVFKDGIEVTMTEVAVVK